VCIYTVLVIIIIILPDGILQAKAWGEAWHLDKKQLHQGYQFYMIRNNSTSLVSVT